MSSIPDSVRTKIIDQVRQRELYRVEEGSSGPVDTVDTEWNLTPSARWHVVTRIVVSSLTSHQDSDKRSGLPKDHVFLLDESDAGHGVTEDDVFAFDETPPTKGRGKGKGKGQSTSAEEIKWAVDLTNKGEEVFVIFPPKGTQVSKKDLVAKTAAVKPVETKLLQTRYGFAYAIVHMPKGKSASQSDFPKEWLIRRFVDKSIPQGKGGPKVTPEILKQSTGKA
jgi:hypothetical protein